MCCDGLRGLPDAITATLPQASVQTCVVQLVLNTLRYASNEYWSTFAKQLRVICTALTVEAAEAAFEEFAEHWEHRDRVAQRQIQCRDQTPWPLPRRAGSIQGSLLGVRTNQLKIVQNVLSMT